MGEARRQSRHCLGNERCLPSGLLTSQGPDHSAECAPPGVRGLYTAKPGPSGRASAALGLTPGPPSLCPVTFHRWSKGWARPGSSWESADLEGEPVSAQEEKKLG